MATFDLAIPVVLANEGGYTWDAADPGGETKYGISKKSYPNVDIANLTLEQAKAIYLRDFWLFGGIVDQDVATKLFDSYVNQKHYAIKISQKVAIQLSQQIAGAVEDGIYGPHTEAMINACNPQKFLTAFRIGLVAHYSAIVAANPAEGKYLAGWLRRANQ